MNYLSLARRRAISTMLGNVYGARWVHECNFYWHLWGEEVGWV